MNGIDLDAEIASAHERARRAARERTVDALLAGDPIATTLTTRAAFELSTPVDLPERGLRVMAIEVSTERHLGTDPKEPDTLPGEPPVTEVRGWAQPLKQDGRPDKRSQPSWTYLPAELAPILLGKAMTS